MTDFLGEKQREITDRLNELAPLVEEYRGLEAAATALDGIGGASSGRKRGPGRPRGSGKVAAASTTTRKKPGRPEPKQVGRPKKVGGPPGTGRSVSATKRRPGRRKGSGTRAAQALTLVQGQPGITIPELAAKMGIKQTYLYRVLPGLEQEGKVAKDGRGWHPKT